MSWVVFKTRSLFLFLAISWGVMMIRPMRSFNIPSSPFRYPSLWRNNSRSKGSVRSFILVILFYGETLSRHMGIFSLWNLVNTLHIKVNWRRGHGIVLDLPYHIIPIYSSFTSLRYLNIVSWSRISRALIEIRGCLYSLIDSCYSCLNFFWFLIGLIILFLYNS